MSLPGSCLRAAICSYAFARGMMRVLFQGDNSSSDNLSVMTSFSIELERPAISRRMSVAWMSLGAAVQ